MSPGTLFLDAIFPGDIFLATLEELQACGSLFLDAMSGGPGVKLRINEAMKALVVNSK